MSEVTHRAFFALRAELFRAERLVSRNLTSFYTVDTRVIRGIY